MWVYDEDLEPQNFRDAQRYEPDRYRGIDDAINSLDNKFTIQDSSTLLTMSVCEKEVSLISFVEKLTLSGVERKS